MRMEMGKRQELAPAHSSAGSEPTLLECDEGRDGPTPEPWCMHRGPCLAAQLPSDPHRTSPPLQGPPMAFPAQLGQRGVSAPSTAFVPSAEESSLEGQSSGTGEAPHTAALLAFLSIISGDWKPPVVRAASEAKCSPPAGHPGPGPGTSLGLYICRPPEGWLWAGRGRRGSKRGGLAPAPASPSQCRPGSHRPRQPPLAPPAQCPFRAARVTHLSGHLSLRPLPGYLQRGVQASAPMSLPNLSLESRSSQQAPHPVILCPSSHFVSMVVCLPTWLSVCKLLVGRVCRLGSQLWPLPESCSGPLS